MSGQVIAATLAATSLMGIGEVECAQVWSAIKRRFNAVMRCESLSAFLELLCSSPAPVVAEIISAFPPGVLTLVRSRDPLGFSIGYGLLASIINEVMCQARRDVPRQLGYRLRDQLDGNDEEPIVLVGPPAAAMRQVYRVLAPNPAAGQPRARVRPRAVPTGEELV